MRQIWAITLIASLALQCQSAPSSVGPDPVEPGTPPPEPPPPPPEPPPGPPPPPGPTVIDVRNQAELVAALRVVRPGDEIRLADGVYQGGIVITQSGTPEKPITLRGGRSARIDGGGFHGAAISLRASHWILRGMTVTNGLWGVYVLGGNHNLLDSLEIAHVGQEAVHFLQFSSDNTIRRSSIHDTGLAVAEYGEGVYIGSAVEAWGRVSGGLADQSDRNQVLDNVIGPNVRSEHVDAKEGTTGGIIRGNRFLGEGMVQSRFWVDSWVEIKGNDYQVLDNTGSDAINDGFQVFSVVGGWGNGNLFRRNVADVQAGGFGIRIDGGSDNVVGCDNVVTSAAAGFSSVPCVEVAGDDGDAIRSAP